MDLLAWDTAPPNSVYRDQIASVCGEAAVLGMLVLCSQLEHVTITLEEHRLGLTSLARE